jgi:hypothetical protein
MVCRVADVSRDTPSGTLVLDVCTLETVIVNSSGTEKYFIGKSS